MSGTVPARASFVVFPLDRRRFALPTADVVELARAGQVQTFPHTTPGLEGVLLRRGEILPVWELAASLGTDPGARKFWLITRRNFAAEEPTAIPVSGECQMLRAEVAAPPEGAPAYVSGVLSIEDQLVEVLELPRLAAPRRPVEAGRAKEPPKEGEL